MYLRNFSFCLRMTYFLNVAAMLFKINEEQIRKRAGKCNNLVAYIKAYSKDFSLYC